MLRPSSVLTALCIGSVLPAAAAAPATSLAGSPASMVHQNRVAKAADLSFLRDAAAVRRMADQGHLVRVEPSEDVRLAAVSFPYARPAVATFIERLGAQYRDACGEPLVVTSLTRPAALQPRNAHPLSVHPAGMAVDLRVSQKAACRAWLEGTLLSLERQGLLDATREKRPPHYHVAVFPEAYAAHVARLEGADPAPPPPAEPVPATLEPATESEPTPLEQVLAAAPAEPALEVPPVPARPHPAGLALLASGLLLVAGVAVGRRARRGQEVAAA